MPPLRNSENKLFQNRDTILSFRLSSQVNFVWDLCSLVHLLFVWFCYHAFTVCLFLPAKMMMMTMMKREEEMEPDVAVLTQAKAKVCPGSRRKAWTWSSTSCWAWMRRTAWIKSTPSGALSYIWDKSLISISASLLLWVCVSLSLELLPYLRRVCFAID